MRRLFVLVAAVILVETMFYAAIVPLLPEYSDQLGLSKTSAGILSASYAAGALIAALPSGWLTARVGVRRAMLIGLGLVCGSSLVFAFAENVVVLDLARFAQGVGGTCAWTGGLTWLLAAGSDERRGELVGSVLSVAVAGILLGPVVGGAATVVGPEVVFSAVAALAAALWLWVLATPDAAPAPGISLRRVAGAILTRPVLFAFWLVVLPSMLAGVVDVLAPLRLDELGATGVGVGAVFLLAAAIEAVISPLIGRFSDRRGRLTPIRFGLLAAPVAALAVAIPKSPVLLGAMVVVVFLAMTLIWTPAMTLLSENGESAGLDLAFATALVSLAWAGGQVLGGSAGAGLADVSSDAVAYAATAGFFLLTLGAILSRRGAAARMPSAPGAAAALPRRP
jgi:MFS family permease